VIGLPPLTRSSRHLLLLLSILLLIGGCSPSGDVPALPDPLIVGGPGKGDGLFHQPRAITALADGSCVVIDRSGRVQRFDPSGLVAASWSLPEFSRGQPIDVTASPWGTLLVADTHYARVLEFDLDGVEIGRFGEDLDLEIVRGIAVGNDGSIYVADYGELDRIHRFDRSGRYLGTIGQRGEGEGEFLRPEGLAIGSNGDLFVVDCGHHRVLRFSPQGEHRGTIGEIGSGPGQFLFPMDITSAPDGSLYVVDFQGNRVQRFDDEGNHLGTFGGAGTEPGRFATPRGVTVHAEADGHRVYVADTNNHRIQIFLWPDSAAAPRAARGGSQG